MAFAVSFKLYFADVIDGLRNSEVIF